jgi:hypothetical protein
MFTRAGTTRMIRSVDRHLKELECGEDRYKKVCSPVQEGKFPPGCAGVSSPV